MFKDIRYAIRTLLKQPGFLVVALATLTLGIGATTAMFTVVNSVLLRPMQFPEPERIAILEAINPHLGINESNVSVPDLVEWQQQSQSFEQIAGFVSGGVFLASGGDDVERVSASGVSAEFFPLFRASPLSGRVFQASDAQDGSEPVVVISHALWQRRFGGTADAVNRQVVLNGKTVTIVGIMPAGFNYPNDTELWTAYPLDASKEVRDNRYLNAIGRLKPGVSIAQAQAELDTINQRLAQSFSETNVGWGVRLTELRERMVGELRPALLMLFGSVAFVLLIACANVANLLLARAAYRQKEIAVRTALGASRWRVVKQLLTESLLLSVVSGVAGLALSVWLIKLLIAISPPNSPRFNEISINWQVFAFAFGLTILAGLLFGLVPALQTSRTDLNETLKESGRSGSPGGSRNRIGGFLIVSEVALSFVLLAGAGLLIKSFMHLSEIDPGFQANNVLAMRLTLPAGKYKQGEPRVQIYQQLLEKVKAVPGVQAAGAVLSLPLGGDTFNLGRGVLLEGRPAVPEAATSAAHLAVTPDYFRTLNIPLKQGRMFTDYDNTQSTKVVIVNETMARRQWPGESPVGKRFSIWRDEKFSREVVGVVGDTKASLDKEGEQQMYVPYAQDANWGSLSFVVRTSGVPTAVAGAVREAIKSVDKGVATYNLKTMNDVVATSAAPRRVPMLLLSSFAGVAMLLAMIGIYGITSYYVTQRTREIGVRMALGAQIADVLKLVLRRAMLLAVIGVVVGVAGSIVVTRYLETLLFGVKPIDVITFVAVAFGLVLVALLASLIPARRATKVDPLTALRYE
ncbi:MAG TPA: ABC transporter permease [Pyrinomonadaceae bacterium]|nr:ABC transporter permease [Pyrinomonadaceae bacterium]